MTEQSAVDESFAVLVEEYMPLDNRRFEIGDKITGYVISIGKSDIVISTGTKWDGVVSLEEFQDKNGNLNCREGDEVELYVVSMQDNTLYLSKAVSGVGGLETLQNAFVAQLPVRGKVSGICKGGFQIEIMHRRAFCPVSQIDSCFVEDGESYVGKSFDFMITKLEQNGRNIIVSRRLLLERKSADALQDFLETVKVGDSCKGRVVRLEKFGAFVELVPGVEGLVHISEISWSRILNPQEVLTVDGQVNVKILKMEKDGKGHMRISLSIKQAESDPWDSVGEKLKVGDVVNGKVVRCTAFGAFVELLPAIEGLIHISELSYVKRVTKPEDVVVQGQQVSVIIKEIDSVNRRIALSLRDVQGDPWYKAAEKYVSGQIVEGVLEKKEKFGWFIALEPGIVGLLPASRLAKAENKSEMDALCIGTKLQVRIDSVLSDEKRISLYPVNMDSENAELYWNEHKKQESENLSFGNLGEKLQQALKK